MKIIYQDEDILVCIKPSGALSTDEAGGMPELIRQTIGEEHEIRTVHRLDSVVAGLMVYALSKTAASGLTNQITDGTFTKEYMAVIEGRPEKAAGELHDYLIRNKRERKTYVVQKAGRGAEEAILHYKTLDVSGDLSLVRVKLVTGRTHQIRAQFSTRHLPLYGDGKYGSKNRDARIALWSCHLSFRHPVNGKLIDISAKPPKVAPWNVFHGVTEQYAAEDIAIEFQKSPSFRACPYAEDCGFCAYQGVEYEKQLEKKQKKCAKWLKNLGEIQPIIAMEEPIHYRNKAEVFFDTDKNGRIISGLYSKAARRVIRLSHCSMDHPIIGEITAALRKLMEELSVYPYNEKDKSGWLRKMVVRVSTEGKVLLLLEAACVTGREKALLDALILSHPEIQSVHLNEIGDRKEIGKGKQGARGRFGETRLLYGASHLEDSLCGVRFSLDARSFFPLNPMQAESVFQIAMELANLEGGERVLDVCCGAGMLSALSAQKAKKVLAVDLPNAETKKAERQAKSEGIGNIRFVLSEPETYLEALARSHDAIDVLFFQTARCRNMDACMKAAGSMKPKTMVYISGDLERMAADLAYMKERGYQVETIQPVDILPFTEHVECIACLHISN